MSEHREDFDAQNVAEASEESDDAFETVNIPVPTEELPESPETEGSGSEVEPSAGGRATLIEESDQSLSSLETNDEPLIEGVITPGQVSFSPKFKKHYLTKSDNAVKSGRQYSYDSVTLMDKIKAAKESLKMSMKEAVAIVKVILLPVGQEIIMSFKIDAIFEHLKDHFSYLLKVPSDVLQIRYSGIVVKNNETLIQHGVKPQDIIQVEIFSTHPDLYPIKRLSGFNDVSQIITFRVQTGIHEYQEIAVEIIKSDFHKPFLGGFRHKVTGIEYHNAGTQTLPKKIPEKFNLFCRDTQTVFQRKKLQQTTKTTSTQMTEIGVYVSNMTDKLVTPGKYFSAAEYHAQRLKAVIVIQTYYRQWHAKIVVENLRRQKMLRLKWEEQEEQRKIREKEEWMKLDYYRRHNPQTKEDFELLYNALELWQQEEIARINQSFTGAERKAALCELLEKEIQIIASIGRHRYIADRENKEALLQTFLNKCSAPKIWRTFNGKKIEMDTQFTIRARELQNIYECIMLKNISQDERLDVLLTLKHTVKEHECKLTQEILELIDREVDLMTRGVKQHNLEGLRKRIATLFFHYIKTPLFNPEAARYLKVPQDPLKFYKKIYFCHSCQLYLPSTEFAISSTSQRIYRCRHCVNLDNETRRRESFLKYKCLLKRLYYSEADYEDDSKIAFLMKLQDIQYLTENIWASQSVLSAWNDLSDLAMVRWDKSLEWSPWNCILLTKDEGIAHLRLTNVEEEAECAYTLFVVATFWLTEALPLSVTALLPGLMFPLLGIMPSKEVASVYFKDFHLLLIGVICLATSIEKWNLHKRIALRMVMMVGMNPAWLTLGFMISTAFLSMWLSNTSTAAMVMPIAEAVAQQIISAEAEVEATQMTYFRGSTNHGLEIDVITESVNGQETNERKEKPVPGYSNGAGKISSKMELEKNSGAGAKYRTKKDHMMCKLVCLSVAYSSTIGGLTTITGTSTNLIFAEHFNIRYPNCHCINFGSWFLMSFPAAVIILLLSWIWLQWLFLGFNFKEMFKCGKTKTVEQRVCAEVIKQEYQKLGPIRYQEVVTLVLFIVMALLWFSRDPGFVSGWSVLFSEYPGFATDSTVALLVGLLFFLIPAKRLTKTTPTGEIG